MQKNYRDYTVGELLDMGVKVEINNHNESSKEAAKRFVSQFEGVKCSSHSLTGRVGDTTIVTGWKEKFSINCFI